MNKSNSMDVDALKNMIASRPKKERTEEEIKALMKMTEDLPIVKEYNDSQMHYNLCKNVELKEFNAEEQIFNSEDSNCFGFLIYIGSVNVFNSDISHAVPMMTLLKYLKSGDTFTKFDVKNLRTSNPDVKKAVCIANEFSQIFIFNMADNHVIRTEAVLEKAYDTFDPEIFLMDNPAKLYELIDAISAKVENEFKVFDKYEDNINKLKSEKEIADIMNGFNSKTDFKDIFNYIDSKYSNYTESSLMDMKLGIISSHCLDEVKACNKEIKAEFEEIKKKLYSTTNLKNKNLLMLNIEDELKKDEFKEYIYNKINKDGTLDSLLEKKKINEQQIALNKLKIKKEEGFLLDTFYCVKCHIRARNAISQNCHHLMSCEECIKKMKVCPRCGINIENYTKVYRS